jgi:uncharacterized protein YbcI
MRTFARRSQLDFPRPPGDQMEQSSGNNASGPDNALQAISNGLVHLMSESYGRGPTKAKTYILDDIYVCCIMHEIFTTAEQTLIEVGEKDLVRRTRIAFQTALSDDFKAVVANALGRRVLTYQSQIVFEPPGCFEFFILEEA